MINKKNISVITLEVDYILPGNKITILRIGADVWPNGGSEETPNIRIGFPDVGPGEVDKGQGAMAEFKSFAQLQSYIDDFKEKIKLLSNKTI